ncbi:type II secretion system protein [Burkholderia gladioli]|uniref:type II secretion system protein n=1 Tax=Burkholderia gladioli TaxID=28095 RepID=UPI001641C0A5|nr:hypothetical protein [Burkholderia gladioli]
MKGLEPRRSRSFIKGFTVIEMAITLASLGLITSGILYTIHAVAPVASTVSGTANTGDAVQLDEAQAGLIGFSLAKSSFPTPVGSPVLQVGALTSGELRASDVGVSESPRILYAVDPRLLAVSTLNPDPDNLAQGQLPTRSTPTLPDVCYTLSLIANAPKGTLNGVPVALVTAVIGTTAPTTIPATLPLPGSSQAANLAQQGFTIGAMGPTELYGRLGCPRLLGSVTAHATAVAVANDAHAFTSNLVQLRALQLARVQQFQTSLDIKLDVAIATELLLSIDTSNTAALTIIAIQSARSGASAIPMVANLAGLAVLAGYITSTGLVLDSAKNSLSGLPDGIQAAQTALTNAQLLDSSTANALQSAQVRYSQSLLGI